MGATSASLARWPYLAVAAFVALIHVIWAVAGDGRVLDGTLWGFDGYMRLFRVTTLYETGNWFEPGLARAGAPDGLILHWTRPLDVLLLALALPLVPAMGFKAALFWSGAVISPLLHVITVVALAWAAMPLLRRADAFTAGVLTAAQAGVMGYAIAGHADHHLLFLLIAVLALGFVLRTLAEGAAYRPGYGFAAGACLALGLWVGPEIYVLVALFLTVTGLPWLLLGAPRWAERNLHIAVGLTVCSVLVLLVERGPADYVTVEYDRVSVVHLTVVALAMAFWFAVFRTPEAWRQPGPRLIAAGGGLAAAGTVMWLLFPKILAGPMADVDPAFLAFAALSGMVYEGASIADVPHFLVFTGSAVLAAPWVMWRLNRARRDGDPWPWLLLASSLLVSLALTVIWIRASIYLGLFVSVGLADLIGRVETAISGRLGGATRICAAVLAIVVIAIGPLMLGVVTLEASVGRHRSDATPPTCNLRALTRHLRAAPWKAPPRTILASVNFGPEILYRTDHRVVATLHHRNAAGVLDGIRILAGGDEGESLRLVRRRGIDLVVLCPGSVDDVYLIGDSRGDSLYRRLERDALPDWLDEVPLPPEIGAFRLFRVSGSP